MDPQRVEEMARRHGVLLLVQFGSSVTGLLHPGSDLDFGALVEQVPDSLSAHADFIADLQALVPDREVDLVFFNRADPLLLKQITDHCELIYGSSRRLDQFVAYLGNSIDQAVVERRLERAVGRMIDINYHVI